MAVNNYSERENKRAHLVQHTKMASTMASTAGREVIFGDNEKLKKKKVVREKKGAKEELADLLSMKKSNKIIMASEILTKCHELPKDDVLRLCVRLFQANYQLAVDVVQGLIDQGFLDNQEDLMAIFFAHPFKRFTHQFFSPDGMMPEQEVKFALDPKSLEFESHEAKKIFDQILVNSLEDFDYTTRDVELDQHWKSEGLEEMLNITRQLEQAKLEGKKTIDWKELDYRAKHLVVSTNEYRHTQLGAVAERLNKGKEEAKADIVNYRAFVEGTSNLNVEEITIGSSRYLVLREKSGYKVINTKDSNSADNIIEFPDCLNMKVYNGVVYFISKIPGNWANGTYKISVLQEFQTTNGKELQVTELRSSPPPNMSIKRDIFEIPRFPLVASKYDPDSKIPIGDFQLEVYDENFHLMKTFPSIKDSETTSYQVYHDRYIVRKKRVTKTNPNGTLRSIRQDEIYDMAEDKTIIPIGENLMLAKIPEEGVFVLKQEDGSRTIKYHNEEYNYPKGHPVAKGIIQEIKEGVIHMNEDGKRRLFDTVGNEIHSTKNFDTKIKLLSGTCFIELEDDVNRGSPFDYQGRVFVNAPQNKGGRKEIGSGDIVKKELNDEYVRWLEGGASNIIDKHGNRLETGKLALLLSAGNKIRNYAKYNATGDAVSLMSLNDKIIVKDIAKSIDDIGIRLGETTYYKAKAKSQETNGEFLITDQGEVVTFEEKELPGERMILTTLVGKDSLLYEVGGVSHQYKAIFNQNGEAIIPVDDYYSVKQLETDERLLFQVKVLDTLGNEKLKVYDEEGNLIIEKDHNARSIDVDSGKYIIIASKKNGKKFYEYYDISGEKLFETDDILYFYEINGTEYVETYTAINGVTQYMTMTLKEAKRYYQNITLLADAKKPSRERMMKLSESRDEEVDVEEAINAMNKEFFDGKPFYNQKIPGMTDFKSFEQYQDQKNMLAILQNKDHPLHDFLMRTQGLPMMASQFTEFVSEKKVEELMSSFLEKNFTDEQNKERAEKKKQEKFDNSMLGKMSKRMKKITQKEEEKGGRMNVKGPSFIKRSISEKQAKEQDKKLAYKLKKIPKPYTMTKSPYTRLSSKNINLFVSLDEFTKEPIAKKVDIHDDLDAYHINAKNIADIEHNTVDDVEERNQSFRSKHGLSHMQGGCDFLDGELVKMRKLPKEKQIEGVISFMKRNFIYDTNKHLQSIEYNTGSLNDMIDLARYLGETHYGDPEHMYIQCRHASTIVHYLLDQLGFIVISAGGLGHTKSKNVREGDFHAWNYVIMPDENGNPVFYLLDLTPGSEGLFELGEDEVPKELQGSSAKGDAFKDKKLDKAAKFKYEQEIDNANEVFANAVGDYLTRSNEVKKDVTRKTVMSAFPLVLPKGISISSEVSELATSIYHSLVKRLGKETVHEFFGRSTVDESGQQRREAHQEREKFDSIFPTDQDKINILSMIKRRYDSSSGKK